MSRGRNPRTGSEDTHDRGAGHAARHPAGLAHLTRAGEHLHAPVRAGLEDVRARAKPRHAARDLCRRPRDPVQKGQGRSGLAKPARDHGQAEAHGERGEDTDLHSAGRRVRFPGIHVRTNVFGEDRPGPYRLPAVKEKHSAGGRESPRADRPSGNMARDHNAGGQSEPHVARMGELLPSRNRQQSVSGARRLHSGAVAPVVELQAQSQATRGRELSTLAPLRALRARTPEPPWARRAVDEGVRSCPRAGCGKSARPVVCPAKAGMFSRRKACRGKNQNPVVWIAGWRETKTLKPIDNVSRGEATSHRAVTTVNAKVASKVSSPEGRAPNRRAKAAWGAEI